MSQISRKMTPEEHVKLQQLRILEWHEEQNNINKKENIGKKNNLNKVKQLPKKWKLSKGIQLYKWQEECVESWFDNNYKGTVKVVTGAGKTLLALSISEKLQNNICPDLRVVIVVPTIVLMNQWYDEIIEKGNIPKSYIGRLGGGYKEDFSDGKRILIAVLVSASKKLDKIVGKDKVGNNLMLIVDECHRAGALERKAVLNIQRKYSLGLSATPERDENMTEIDNNEEYNNSELGQSLGKIICQLTYAKALELGIIPPFSIYHYGLTLNPKENNEYTALSRNINDIKQELKYQTPNWVKTGGDFWKWVRNSSQKNNEIGSKAKQLQLYVKKRKDLLYSMNTRFQAAEDIIKKESSTNKDARIILFHESIKDAEQLYFYLEQIGMSVLMEHSNLPSTIRMGNLEKFRKGYAKILVSVKSLIEGFNVPAVDVGIIVASSSSPRQRIQSMGRVLRKHKNESGEEQVSRIYILYAKDTVDESIYGKLDWENILGAKSNKYFHWFVDKEPIEQGSPPKAPPLPKDTKIDINQLGLKPGDEYPGEYEGEEFSCDTNSNITDKEGNLATDAEKLAKLILKINGAGRFKITPNKHYVLIRTKTNKGGWITKYIDTLKEELNFKSKNTKQYSDSEITNWTTNASLGDIYPFNSEAILNLKFSQKRNGTIIKRVKNGEVFARTSNRAEDKDKGKSADVLLDSIRKLVKQNKRITEFEINQHNHAVFRMGGQYYFICELKNELEFPK